MGYPVISFCRDSGKLTETHSVVLHRIVAEDLCALFDIVDGFRMTEFEGFEVTVEHLPPAECTFR